MIHICWKFDCQVLRVTTRGMIIITIEFSMLNGGIFTHENRARWKKSDRTAGRRKSARSKFHFNPEIPRHIMATLLSLSFRFSLPLSLFISSSFFRDTPRREQLWMRKRTENERERESETRTRARCGNTAAAYTCICYCDMDVNRLGGLRRMWGESRFR